MTFESCSSPESHSNVTDYLARGGPAPEIAPEVRLLLGLLPDDLAAPSAVDASVSLSIPEPDACLENWEIQLWLDEDGAIHAAHLILGIP